MRTGPIAKVLLVRLDGLGDAIACAPLLLALRNAGHTIGAALSNRNAGIFAPGMLAAEHVLERIPWPRHGSTRESTARAIASIAVMRYDVALIASEEPEAYRLAAGIGERVGFVTGWAKPIKTLWARSRVTRATFRRASLSDADGHEVETIYRLGGALVADAAPSRDPRVLRTILQGAGVAPARHGIVLQLGTKWTALGVPPECVRAIATALAPHGARAIASPAEAAAARALAGDAPLEVLPSLEAWKNAIDSAAVLVSPDTGAVHLAGMLGVPVVAVFGAHRATAQIARWRPWASPGAAFTSDGLQRVDASNRVAAAALAHLHG